MGLDLLDHVKIAVLDLHGYGSFAVLAVEAVGNVPHGLLFILHFIGIVIPEAIRQLGSIYITLDTGQVVKSFPILCVPADP